MATKTFETRVKFKYGTYSEWTASGAVVLLKGEIGVCEITTNESANTADNTRPVIMFKVGDGTSAFSALPWVSATAADVYAWAKLDYTAFTTKIKNTLGISDTVAADITAALGNYVTSGGLDTAISGVETLINNEVNARETADTNLSNNLTKAYQAADKAILGQSTDEATADTVYGAKAAAKAAHDAANGAKTAADGAKTAADGAQETANTALQKANTAQGEVDALEQVVAGKADATALDNYYTKTAADGKFATKETTNGLSTRIDTNKTAIDTLNGADTVDGSVAKKIKDAKADLVGKSTDTSESDTIKGAKKYADDKVAALVNGAPEALDTLDELAAALNDNANIVQVLTDSIGNKANQSALEAMGTRVEALEAVDHSHSNKAELDTIKTGDVQKWNTAAGKAHTHTNATVLNGITEDKVNTWNSVTGKADSSTVTALESRVETLEQMTLILDCGTPTTVTHK